MSEIVTKSEFAKRVGKLPSAVSNWIARGKLSGSALTADGRIVVDEALRQLDMTVDPGRGAPPPAMRPAADAAQPEPGSLAALRIRRETLAIEQAERQAAIERGELVQSDAVARQWSGELEELLAAVELLFIELPAKLGLGTREAVETARREWREFRRRRAEAARAAQGARDAA